MPAAYKQLRYDEDYGYLQNRSAHSDPFDAIKFIALGADRYLSLGGEIRQRYEYFHNPVWGQEEKDPNGYWLQRYMLHADLHLGNRVRFFGQIKSGIELGREGGPRGADEDKLDLHQAFVDLRGGSDGKNGLMLRLGRQEIGLGSFRLGSFREGPNVRQSLDGRGLPGGGVNGRLMDSQPSQFKQSTEYLTMPGTRLALSGECMRSDPFIPCQRGRWT